MSSSKRALLFAVTAVAIGVVFWSYLQSGGSLEQAIQTEQGSVFDTGRARPEAKPPVDQESGTPEIIESIHEYDLAFRESAQATAENYVSPFSPESMLRWRPVVIEPSAILTDGYLQDGAVPKTFTISPFPDIKYSVTETKYAIRETTESVSWVGTIAGAERGRVEMKIVGGVDNPTFVIRIFADNRIISITPTNMQKVYVAVEGNPYQPERTL